MRKPTVDEAVAELALAGVRGMTLVRQTPHGRWIAVALNAQADFTEVRSWEAYDDPADAILDLARQVRAARARGEL